MCILYHRARKQVNEHEQALNQTENRIGQQLTEQANTKLSSENVGAKEREKKRHECESNAKVTENFTNIECSKEGETERERERARSE